MSNGCTRVNVSLEGRDRDRVTLARWARVNVSLEGRDRDRVTLARWARVDVSLERRDRDRVTLARWARVNVSLEGLRSPRCCKTTPTWILTISIDDHEEAITALRAGAIGHIDKDTNPDELAQLVIRAADGEAIVPQPLIKPLLEVLREVPDTGWRPLHSRLTTREWEIIELLAQGATTQRIAEHLVLSRTTIYSHIKNILRKLGVHTRQDAIIAAERLRKKEALGENISARSC